jgi:hypothetical protein
MIRWPNADKMKRAMNEVIEEHWGGKEKMPEGEVHAITAPPRPRGKKIPTVTKSVATLVAAGEAPPPQQTVPPSACPDCLSDSRSEGATEWSEESK